MKIRLAFRGYAGPVLVLREEAEVDVDEMETVLPKLAAKHVNIMAIYADVTLEVEFLDEPDPMKRFFRMGTTPAAMREPITVDITDAKSIEEGLKKWKGR